MNTLTNAKPRNVSGNSMMKVHSSIFLFTFLLIAESVSAQKPLIEIFLVEKVSHIDTAGKVNGAFFSCTTEDLPQAPFIPDSEIVAYEIIVDTIKMNKGRKNYYLHLTKEGQNKIADLKNISLCCGRPFVIAVNRQPIYSGYFWNYFSSFGSSWITIPAAPSQRLPIERGLPYNYFTTRHKDPRGHEKLLNAMRQTGRLIAKDKSYR